MLTASVADIRRALKEKSNAEMMKIILRLASFKKENKALLNYLLFESESEEGFREAVKEEIREEFLQVNQFSVYQAKKTIRKILKTANNYIRYSGQPQTKAEILLFFCNEMTDLPNDYFHWSVIQNLYNRQFAYAQKAIAALDEDLQFDYSQNLEALKRRVR